MKNRETNPKLTAFQLEHLRRLAVNPAAPYVPPAVLSKLRKLGLVGKVVGRDNDGRQKTTSPITDAGRARLAQP